jgi:hypothetical protein
MIGTSPRTRSKPYVTLSSLISAGLLASCSPADPGAFQLPSAPVTAKGGGGSTGGSTDVQVTGATPSRAPQDTTLTVAISGSGFGTGARAVWSLNGDTTQVIVKSTKVVSSTQVNATIEVPISATVATYSIIVVMPGGKKGVGAEIFIVDERNPTPDFNFDTEPTLGILPDEFSTQYQMGVCGVNTRIFTFGDTPSGDAIMDTGNPRYGDRKCRSYPRKLIVQYGDGITGTATAVNLNRMANALFTIPVGSSAKRGLNINDARCSGLRFKATLQDGRVVPGDSVVVTRTSHTTWVVETQAAPDNRAYCIALDRSFNISARFTIVSDKPIP